MLVPGRLQNRLSLVKVWVVSVGVSHYKTGLQRSLSEGHIFVPHLSKLFPCGAALRTTFRVHPAQLVVEL